MAKIQIKDVNLDGAELFNDSETFLNELQDGEIEQVVGGKTLVAKDRLAVYTVHYPDEPIHPGRPPVHPGRPVHPIKPVHPRKPIKFPHFPHPYTPVIL
ncbi:hypothetical protein Riv7116_0196 [Rivularia sp. PCC 7116]|uniref:hypothetical protein n=1 Tax=Rivularia sp. PCC 7116 TaxID=373994 RepID=UPI00029EC8F4|nr:hypothetical protein [Rivularia sp. PCC 7116]AFY52804.1 hypothetical protein Riv7116_0196 [Rivularia sp. PCC 7116]